MARAAQRDEVLKPLLSVVLIGAVVDVRLNVSAPAQAAAIAVSGMDAPFLVLPILGSLDAARRVSREGLVAEPTTTACRQFLCRLS